MVAHNAKLAVALGSNMKILKWLQRKKVKPIYILPGDSFTLSAYDKVVAHKTLNEKMTIDEVGIFEGKIDGKDALGGVFMGKKQ